MELAIFYIVTAGALLALGGFSFYQTLRAQDMERQITMLSERADDYAAALLCVPDMGGLAGVSFTSKQRAESAREYAAMKQRGARKPKPTAEDFARYVPDHVRAELQSIRADLTGGNNLTAPGADPARIHAAARSTPIQRVIIRDSEGPTLPVMLATAGVLMAATANQTPPDTGPCETQPPTGGDFSGGCVTTPGGLE